MRRAQKRKASNTGGLTIQWWAMRDVRVRLAPPAFASDLRPSRAAPENASRFLSSAPWRVRIPCAGPKQKRSPCEDRLVGDEGCRVRLTPSAFASGLRPSRAALENACAFPQLRTLSGSNPMRWAQKRKASIAGSLSNQWWAMRDSNPQPCACKAPALTVAPIARAERV